jgi:hypothetical protein
VVTMSELQPADTANADNPISQYNLFIFCS